MSVQIHPISHSFLGKKLQALLKPEHLEATPLQEQFCGPIPLHEERSAAEVLTECLAESDPASASLLFIP
jgi:hypothetical protein